MPAKIVATKSTVQIGSLSIDGYLTDAGVFGMSLSDICRFIGWDPKNGPDILKNKWVKSLAAKGFDGPDSASVLGGSSQKIKLISIEWIPSILQCLARSGNDGAWEALNVLAGLSLQQLFCDAFGQKFDATDRQNWLTARMQGIEKRNTWTEAVKMWLEAHPEVSENTRKFMYANLSDQLNRALTGKPAKYWCDLLGCKPATLRDNWKYSHVRKIEELETTALRFLMKGNPPKEAMEKAIDLISPVVDEHPQG